MTKNCSPDDKPADRSAPPVSGLLILDKPAGMTSHTAVQKVRRAFGVRRAGHAGTLDPMATGVLLVGIGQATRLLEYQTREDKGYRARIRLGVRTDTLDREGEVLETRPVPDLSPIRIRQVLDGFLGPQEQTAPAFSAIKVGGERLYRRARRGETVNAPVRRVSVHSLDLVDWSPPDLVIDVDCSKGTYVRSLARDLGRALGSVASLWELRRTRSGPYGEQEAFSLDDVVQHGRSAAQRLVPLAEMVRSLPQVTVNAAERDRIATGRPIPQHGELEPGPCALRTPSGGLVAIGRVENGEIKPHKVFSAGTL